MNKNTKILVIDDQSFMFMMIEKNLKTMGFEHIYYAANGVKALKLLENEDFDLITCDITMPEMDGIETARRIFEKRPDQKLMMVTALGQESILKQAIQAGVKYYLLKPFTPDKFIEKINNILQVGG